MGDVEKQPHTPPGDRHAPYLDPSIMEEDYEGKPTEEEMAVLRRVPGTIPVIAYLICVVEFCERASYYGVQPLISNYVNRPLPDGGNGWGAPPPGDQSTAGALGMGTVVANAVTQSFSMLAYALPLLPLQAHLLGCWRLRYCPRPHGRRRLQGPLGQRNGQGSLLHRGLRPLCRRR
jgi:hypothetical protein